MKDQLILLTGATGFIGGRLLRRFQEQGIRLRCLVRSPKKFQTLYPSLSDIELAEGDLDQGTGLKKALQAAYYLVHSMGPAPGLCYPRICRKGSLGRPKLPNCSRGSRPEAGHLFERPWRPLLGR